MAIGFSFVSDWLRRWREFSRPITEHSKAKPMQSRITFDTQLKITLSVNDKLVIMVCGLRSIREKLKYNANL